jgi:radical SAM protein with 4Fe4S-binding SPASM domain
MKTIGVVLADFERGPLGTNARLDELIAGTSVLRRTLEQMVKIQRLSSCHLLVPVADRQRAEEITANLDVAVEPFDSDPVPWREMIASSRKWGLDGWRGSLASATVFDEDLHPWVLEILAARQQAEAVFISSPAAPLLDPVIADGMIDHFAQVAGDVRMVFTQTAPGLSGCLYLSTFLSDLVQARHPLCRVMTYKPDNPRRDMVAQPCYYTVDADIAIPTGRLIADTGVSIQRIADIFSDCSDDGSAPDALTAARWLKAHRFQCRSDLPDEVEIEITTETPLPETTLRPAGQALERQGEMPLEMFTRLIDEIVQRDDVRVVLGGFGDPLSHPQFAEMVAYCRDAGVFGLAVRTTAIDLNNRMRQTLLDARVDILNITLDAISPGRYQHVHKRDAYNQVVQQIEQLCVALHQQQRPVPLIVCEMAKTKDLPLAELEQFYDHWTAKTGSAVIIGPSHYGGRREDFRMMSMAPPARRPCERLFHRIMILSDGRVVACDQDFTGAHAVGSISDRSLSSIWKGAELQALRESHLAGRYDTMALCPACEEWHRP